MITVNDIAQQTGLTPYLLTVIYDFHSHKLLGVRPHQHKESLGAWYSPNPNLPSMRGMSNGEIKTMVSKREVALKKLCDQGQLTPEKKDQLLVHEFLGWTQTTSGHFLYIYFTGERKEDMARAEFWELVHKDHLSLFHTRIGGGVKELKKCYSLNSMDIRANGANHLALDVRYITRRWFNSSENEKHKTLLRDHVDLFKKGSDYLVTLYRAQEEEDDEEEVGEIIVERNVSVVEVLKGNPYKC